MAPSATDKKLDAIWDEVKNVLDRLKSLEDYLPKLGEHYDAIIAQVSTLQKENADLQDKVTALEKKEQENSRHLNILDQATKRHEVEVAGIPSTTGEDPKEIVTTLGKVCDCPLTTADVAQAYRISRAGSTDDKPIIATFHNPTLRDDFIKKCKSRRPTVKDLNPYPPTLFWETVG